LGFTSREDCCDPLYLWVITVLVLVAAVILLGAAGLLDLLEGEAVSGTSNRLALRVEALGWGRSSRGPRLSRWEYFGLRCL
jgi:hypothetical protein